MDYTQYITGNHADKPKFVKTIQVSTEPSSETQELLRNTISKHFFDVAEGAQLDTVGVWIGFNRYVKVPLKDTFFSWDTIDINGWDGGVWGGDYGSDFSYVKLDDDSYRMLLNMKIATNRWKGNLPDGYQIWDELFGSECFIFILDNQDMSIVLYIAGDVPSPIIRLIQGGIMPFKPESVRVKCYMINTSGEPAFGFDVDNEYIAGWGKGIWPMEINR